MRIATFNVSIEASNYCTTEPLQADIVRQLLQHGNHPQISNIAEIIQRVRPDILLLNEFDYIEPVSEGIEAFIKNYLNQPQNDADAIDYPYYYVAPVNSGLPSPFDITGDGVASGTGGDAYGFGFYPGQYGMALLSQFPIEPRQIRTFQQLRWATMPDREPITHADGTPFYDADTVAGLRLSSKSHWDVPIQVGSQLIHILAAHPTPPVFDGPERRNRARNHDEIRLWADYIDPDSADYIIDDGGQRGGLSEQQLFVILGDYNASPDEGDSKSGAIQQLLNHPRVNATSIPTSIGAKQHSANNRFAASHTASWRARVDYVLPSKELTVTGSGVFWPPKHNKLHRLVGRRDKGSDHRLVWLDIQTETDN